MKRKNRVIYGLTALLLVGAPLILTNCGRGETGGDVGGNTGDKTKITKFVVALSSDKPVNVGQTVNVDAKVVTPVGATGNWKYEVESGSENIISVNANGTVTALAVGEGTVKVTCLNAADGVEPQTIKITVIEEAKDAVGAFNYVASTYEEKLDILGKIEEYAVKQHLTGLTLFENGGIVLYNPRIRASLPDTYISGYGFGALTEGKITAPIASPVEKGKEMYYHTFAGTRNNHDFNYLDDTGSVTSDLYGYVSSTYYSTKMNSARNGYDWYPLLAKENPSTVKYVDEAGEEHTLNLTGDQLVRPVALNKDPATKLATKYKVFVRTGDTDAGLTYKTNSKKYSQFNGRKVALEDYVTPYRLLLTQGIGLARSTDMISDTSDSTLKGAKAYYNQTKNKSNIEENADLFDQLVGLKADPSDNSLTFTFNSPLSEFEAMTSLSSTLTSPIPAEFIKTIGRNAQAPGISGTVSDDDVYRIGMKNAYGTSNNNGTTPVDNLLSLSPYTLEADTDKYISYKRNDDWFERKIDSLKHRNTIEGIALVYNAAAESNTLATWEMFNAEGGDNAGQIDAVSIPKEKISQFANDSRAKKTQGDSTFKLNLNTCTQEEWEAIFGTEGTNPSSKGHYDVKPLMSNDKFVDALSFAINREEYASNRGSNPSQSFFAPAYLWEPEQGFSYDETPQHKAAIADYSPSTFGYNVGVAAQLMDQAIAEEIENGNYDNYSDSETIDIHWMNPTDPEEFGNDLVVYFNKAFELTNAKKQGFRLTFRNVPGTNNYQEVYEKMTAGHFDLGFGSISGMTLDPLGFLEIMKSNNITGFTLNYSGDTSIYDENNPSTYITYDNKKWSFDSLWTAANKGAVIGADKKVVEEPLKIAQSGTGSVQASFKLGNETIAARQLRLQYERDVQATSEALSIKLRNSTVESVVVSISFSVEDGDKIKNKSVSFSIQTGDQFKINGEKDGFELPNKGTIDILIPEQINSKTTNGQVIESFTYKDIKSCVLSINYYMEIDGVTTTTTISTKDLKF